jgi:hypothetical protein
MRMPQRIIVPTLIGLILLFRISSDEHSAPPVSARLIPLVPSPINRPQLAYSSLTAISPAPAPLRRLAESAPPPRLLLTEDLILALDEGRSLEEMRPVILALYPDLADFFHEDLRRQQPNKMRRAAEHFRLRHELTRVVLADYSAAIRDLP